VTDLRVEGVHSAQTKQGSMSMGLLRKKTLFRTLIFGKMSTKVSGFSQVKNEIKILVGLNPPLFFC